MVSLHFNWDEAKARSNLRKHGVTFEEAKSVFYDSYAVAFFDDEHALEEDRFLLLGMSAKARLLLICHCYRERESVIRIISARRATPAESQHYERPIG